MPIWILSLLVVCVIINAICFNYVITNKSFDEFEKTIGATAIAAIMYMIIFYILNEIL